jgi:hypothetical protein
MPPLPVVNKAFDPGGKKEGRKEGGKYERQGVSELK